MGGGGGWSAGGGLYILLGLFRVAMSPRNASDLRDILLTLRLVSDPYLPSSVLHGLHCLSYDFTWLAKLALENQTS